MNTLLALQLVREPASMLRRMAKLFWMTRTACYVNETSRHIDCCLIDQLTVVQWLQVLARNIQVYDAWQVTIVFS
jgi:hypothetical protein